MFVFDAKYALMRLLEVGLFFNFSVFPWISPIEFSIFFKRSAICAHVNCIVSVCSSCILTDL